jgi:hypothetical protein
VNKKVENLNQKKKKRKKLKIKLKSERGKLETLVLGRGF